MTAHICFTMDNLGDAADLGRGVIDHPREPGHRPALEQGFPAMLELYGRHDITLTHFVEGWNGEAHPEEIRQLLDRGHSVGMHGWQHEKWAELSNEKARELAIQATDRLEKAAGVRPHAFRAPGGRTTEFTRALLVEQGYMIDASIDPSGIDGGPVQQLNNGLWSIPYYWNMVDATHWLWQQCTCGEVEALWRHALQQAAEHQQALTFIWHPHVMGIDPHRLAVGDSILRFVREDDRFHIVTLEELVKASAGQPQPSG